MATEVSLDQQDLPVLSGEKTEFSEPIDPERIEFESHFEGGGTITEWRELFLAFGAISAWFLLFSGGTLISTAPYIDALTKGSDRTGIFTNSTMIVLFWTITNIGFLAIISAILGAFGQRTHFTTGLSMPGTIIQRSGSSRRAVREVYIHYASAAMRGFGIYILFLSGLLVIATDVLIAPNQGQYVRMAGMVSVVSLYVGYEPGVLAGLFDRIRIFKKIE